MSNAIGSSRESNPSRRICNLRAVPLGHVADMKAQVKRCRNKHAYAAGFGVQQKSAYDQYNSAKLLLNCLQISKTPISFDYC